MYQLIKYLDWDQFNEILNQKGIIKLFPEEKSDDSGFISFEKPKIKTGKYHLWIETIFSANDVNIDTSNQDQKNEYTLEAEETIEHDDSIYVLFSCFPTVGHLNQNYFITNHKYAIVYNQIEKILLDLNKINPIRYSNEALQNVIGVSPIEM